MKLKPLTLATTLGLVMLVPSILVGVTISEFPPDPEGVYSPWADLNDNGEIEIFDIVWLATRYGETGTPVNKTALLYYIGDTFAMLLDKIDSLNSTVIEQRTIINNLNNTMNNLNNTVINLNNTVTYLNETVTYLNSTGLGTPDPDSGWVNFPTLTGIPITHNLGTMDIIVYMWGKDAWGGIHQRAFGGDICNYNEDKQLELGGLQPVLVQYMFTILQGVKVIFSGDKFGF